MADNYGWRRTFHLPVLAILQIVFIILFSQLVVYDPETVVGHEADANTKALEAIAAYPKFQDVNIMLFLGIGFLMSFLRQYGLSSVTLNMLCGVVSVEWAALVIGFFHLHRRSDGTAGKVVYMNMMDSMVGAEFAAASAMISFGVVLGKASPLQMIFMALAEIALYFVNDYVGRQIIGAVDTGCTIFVHLFAAYFGVTVSLVMYKKYFFHQEKLTADRTSDMFSLVGTVFLWMMWPSFNACTAVPGQAQHRAILNSYFSLCSCVVTTLVASAALNRKHNWKFELEHVQNATLAGGVVIGVCADLIVEPYGALIVGGIAGVVSTLGFKYVTPFLETKLKIHDTCGVHNLHGLPSWIGAFMSCVVARVATYDKYGNGLYEVYPLMKERVIDGKTVAGITGHQQALNQLAATACTLAIAIAGGAVTGFCMRLIGQWQHLDSFTHTGMKDGEGVKGLCFDDHQYILVHEDDVGNEEQGTVPAANGTNGTSAAVNGSMASIATQQTNAE